MEDGRNGKNGVPVRRNVTKALGTEREVVVDQNPKDLDENVPESLYKPVFVT